MLYVCSALLAAALLGLDQWLKHYVTVNIPLGEAQPLLPGVVELRTVHNYGAAWSSFSGMRWVLVAVTIGGSAMGILGMLVMVPAGSVIYTLLRSGTAARLKKRDTPVEKYR